MEERRKRPRGIAFKQDARRQLTNPRVSQANSHAEGRWPGIELYYPPIKYQPRKKTYESIEEARRRFEKWGRNTLATTLLFDLEDGCQRKAEARELLREIVPVLDRPDLIVALRINPFRTEEYEKDLLLLADIKSHIDVVELAKAGEGYGAAEVRDLSSWLIKQNANIAVEPIIEHPRALHIADAIMDYDTVFHIVFGIHDFSKALGVQITPHGWMDQLRTWRDLLLLQARLKGKGVVGGVETPIVQRMMPEIHETQEIETWLEEDADDASQLIYKHALDEARFGLTGKQVIHPYHVPICLAAFVPPPSEVKRNIEILSLAREAQAFEGGAILFEGAMLDPPMFGKALQVLLRAAALGALDRSNIGFVQRVVDDLPDLTVRENWPYSVYL